MDDASALRIENKIRSMMLDLIEPTIRRSTDSAEILGKIVHTVEILSMKMQDMEIVQSKTLNRLNLLDDFGKRFLELNAAISLVETKMTRDKQDTHAEIYALSQTSHSMKEEITVLEHQRLSMKNDIASVSQSIMNTKYEIEKKLEIFKDEYRDKLTNNEERLTRSEVVSEEIYKKIKKLSKEIIEINSKTSINEHQSNEHSSSIKSLNDRIDYNRNEATINFESLRNSIIKHNSEILKHDKTINSLKKEQKKIEQATVKNDLKITQPLYKIFTDVTILKTLAAYDLERLGNSEDKDSSVDTIIDGIRTKAEEVLKMETPKLQKVESTDSKKKKKRIATKRFDGDEIVKPKEVTMNSYQDSEISDKIRLNGRKKSIAFEQILPKKNDVFEISSINPVISFRKPSETESWQNKSKASSSLVSKSRSDSDSEIVIPEQIDFMPMINTAKEEVQKDFNDKLQMLTKKTEENIEILQISLNVQIKQIYFSISAFKESVAGSFKELQKKIHDLELVTQQVVYECNSQLNNRKRENNDFNYELKQVQAKLETANQQYQIMTDATDKISQRFATMVEYCSIANALQIQDEFDRESIALMGYKETKGIKGHPKPGKAIVALDKQCFSCTGQSSVVLNAFKIACLTYMPSPVVYRNDKYSRRDLYDMLNRLLKSLMISPQDSSQLEKCQRAASTTLKNFRPATVPSPQASPHSDFPDPEFPRILRKSINYQ
ncbi:hypothetical protein SteCoe_32178 [Stentor coeruleus]|uniref:Uncharacterized protein n=1 Tax=Stentor coeruleus TaxID=5963 RepID=A0A1R2AZK3_9CILI|nr:hypothetical protein SteCoe_32178 [Stentor coeruleus]